MSQKSAPLPEPSSFAEAERLAADRSISPQALYQNLLAAALAGDENDPGVHHAIETVRSAYPADFDRFLSSIYVTVKFVQDRPSEIRHIDVIEVLYLYLKNSKSTAEIRETLLSPLATPLANTRVN